MKHNINALLVQQYLQHLEQDWGGITLEPAMMAQGGYMYSPTLSLTLALDGVGG
jgi:hypothetical protein